jgi:hypothetical protein
VSIAAATSALNDRAGRECEISVWPGHREDVGELLVVTGTLRQISAWSDAGEAVSGTAASVFAIEHGGVPIGTLVLWADEVVEVAPCERDGVQIRTTGAIVTVCRPGRAWID